MATTPERVNPGDLITASLMNDILKRLADLETAIGQLPAASQVKITGLYPSGPLHIGDKLTVLGRNFGSPASNTVTLNEAVITKFDDGSDGNHLVFTIPVVQAATDQGAMVTLTVTNSQGSDSTTVILIKAAEPLAGRLEVDYHEAPAVAKIEAGKSYNFIFTVNAITTQDETFTLAPWVGDDKWHAEAVNQDGNPISEVPIPENSSRDVTLRLTTPANIPDASTMLRLTVTSKQKPTAIFNTSGNVPVKVGAAPPPPPSIHIDFVSIEAPGQAGETLTIPAMPPPPDKFLHISLNVKVGKQGNYAITAPTFASNPGNLWEASISSNLPPSPLTPGNYTFMIRIRAKSTAAVPTNLLVEMTSPDDPTTFGNYSQPIKTA